ncbi:MAG: hypothetical protein J5555_06490 [Firmicutes bacterium]|nr:hypothetical protein [Bacillota bacterium]
MLSYERFKQAVRSDLKKYMPAEYADHRLVEKKIYKINRCVDTFRLQPPGPASDTRPMPTLNYQDLYRSIVCGARLENVLRSAAEAMQCSLPPEVEEKCLQMQDDRPDVRTLHLALINRNRNRQLLKNVPHHDFLDLAAIAVLEEGPQSGYLCVVTNDILKELDMDPETLLKTACENTFREYPSVLEESQLGLNAWCEGSTFGAVCLLDKEMLKEAAETLDSDLYVLPDSLHLLFIVAVKSVPRGIILETFRRASLLEPDAFDYLSDNVYYYDRKKEKLTILKDRDPLPA